MKSLGKQDDDDDYKFADMTGVYLWHSEPSNDAHLELEEAFSGVPIGIMLG